MDLMHFLGVIFWIEIHSHPSVELITSNLLWFIFYFFYFHLFIFSSHSQNIVTLNFRYQISPTTMECLYTVHCTVYMWSSIHAISRIVKNRFENVNLLSPQIGNAINFGIIEYCCIRRSFKWAKENQTPTKQKKNASTLTSSIQMPRIAEHECRDWRE